MKFCIIDVSNLVHRAKHAVGKKSNHRPYSPFADEDMEKMEEEARLGLVLNVVFNSLLNAFDRFGSEHVVACFDSWSWRKEIYPLYKTSRQSSIKTPEDEAAQKMIHDVIDQLEMFLTSHTNVTVLSAPGVEADDFIARWVQLHEGTDDEHLIVSGDTDFKQLVSPLVNLYNPLQKTLYTVDGIFYQDEQNIKMKDTVVKLYGEKWKVKLDKDTGEPEKFDPKWELFYKCIRGDKGDTITSAYPRVHVTKMRAAFQGDVEQWNNFINSTWGKDVKQSVRDLYERNKTLIDLTCQPDEIKDLMDETIAKAVEAPPCRLVGAYFAKFCSKYKLVRLASRAGRITSLLSKRY